MTPEDIKHAIHGLRTLHGERLVVLDLFKAEGGKKVHNELRIVEVEFLETLNQ